MSHPDDTDSELRRAAFAGAQLYEARVRFRRYAEEAMNAFSTAESELEKTGHDAIFRAVEATDIAFAGFIAAAEAAWDEEEDFEYATPPDILAWHAARRNRLDDYRDGRLCVPPTLDFVEAAFLQAADFLSDSDPAASRRMLRLAATWNADRLRFESEPEWARKNGIIPGAETAPSMAALLSRFGQREESHDVRRAGALRMGAIAYRQLHAASTAYASACCAEYVYTSAIGEKAS